MLEIHTQKNLFINKNSLSQQVEYTISYLEIISLHGRKQNKTDMKQNIIRNVELHLHSKLKFMSNQVELILHYDSYLILLTKHLNTNIFSPILG